MTNYPLVHIAPDEKFIDAAQAVYEKAFPGKNLFIVHLKNRESQPYHVSKNKAYHFVYQDEDYIKAIEQLDLQPQYLIFHGMDFFQAEIALKINLNCSMIWTLLGWEVYKNPYINLPQQYGSTTYKRYIKGKSTIEHITRSLLYRLTKNRANPFKRIKMALKKMDYVAISYQEEFEKFQQLDLFQPKVKWISFFYYPLDVIITQDRPWVKEDNILLGNSASYSNNHLEAFQVLKTLQLGTRQIITPLSYGKAKYGREIQALGQREFPRNFKALIDFLPLKTYQNIIHSCGIVIMFHYRQQAVGNVLDCLYNGSKVYLSRRNTLFHYLKRLGCHVYTIEEDLTTAAECLQLLSEEQMLNNRRILQDELALSTICSALHESLKIELS